jgi:tetratricopeptide (TPR) repeat protein
VVIIMNNYPRKISIIICSALVSAVLAVNVFGQQPTGVVENELPLTGPAYHLTEEVYKAYSVKDYDTALARIREAQRLRPDVARLRQLEKNILEAKARQTIVAPASVRSAPPPPPPTTVKPSKTRTVAKVLPKAAAASRTRTTPQATQDPAWKAANAAYSALNRQDTAGAITNAQEAVRLAPERGPSQLLLADALEQAKRYADAEQALSEAIGRLGHEENLEARRDVIRRKMAEAPAAGGYEAMIKKDPAKAAQDARKAIALSPDMMAYRLLLLDALLAMDNYGEAEQAASEAVSRDTEDIVPLVMRAYIRMKLGKHDEAFADYDTAIHQKNLSETELRAVRLLASDAARVAGDPQRAIDLLLPLGEGNDNAVNGRIKSAREALAAKSRTQPQTYAQLIAPTVSCRVTPYGPSCSLSTDPEANGYAVVSAAYKAVLAKDDKKAFALFAQANQDGVMPATAYTDAAFSAIRTSHNAEALSYFKRSIDASKDGTLEQTPQQVFETRQAVAEISRTWGGYVFANYRGMSSLPGSGGLVSTTGDSVQVGTEVFWRPPVIGYNNGRIFEVYGRIVDTPYNQISEYQGSKTFQGTLGARYKPINIINFFLAMEREIPIGSLARHDWLALASYSFDHGTFLRKDKPSWFTAQLGVQAGHYLEQDENIGYFEAKLGRSYRVDMLSPNLVLFPHGVIGGDYDSIYTDPDKRPAMGAGAGVNLRYFFNEDEYTAPRSYFDVSLQYRFQVVGDARAKGIFLRSTFYY